MNNKITFNQLSERVATATGLSIPGAESMIKEFFALVSDSLLSGESVNVNGLGTFSLSGDANAPVSFIPDKGTETRVNAPFSLFQPEVLGNGVTEELLASASSDETAPRPEKDIQIIEPTVDRAETKQVNNEVEATVNEIHETPVYPQQPPVVIPPVVIPSIPDNNTPPTEETVAEETTVFNNETEPGLTANDETTYYQNDNEEDDEPIDNGASNSRFGIGFIVGLITGLAIGALGVFIYMSETMSSVRP